MSDTVEAGDGLDLYVIAQQQFERALSWIDDLKSGLIDYLVTPKRTVHVRFPIHMDDDSVRATTRAARANMVDGVTARRAVIGRDRVAPAPILLANITLEVLRVLAAALAGHADATVTRHAVLSGLRPYEVDDAVRAFVPLGLAARARREEDGWASVRLSV